MKHSFLTKAALSLSLVLSPLALNLSTTQLAMAQDTQVPSDEVLAHLRDSLLNDPDFITAVAEKAATSPDKEAIEKIVHRFLIRNPEVLFDMQESLEAKYKRQDNNNVANIIQQSQELIYNSPNDPVFGNPDGAHVLVEFFDYNCGYCKKAFPDMMALIERDPQLRIVMKELPILGNDSLEAHTVAQAFHQVMPEKYLEFHEKMMNDEARATRDTAMDLAVELGADREALEKAMRNPLLQDIFSVNAQLAYQLGITGTPSYIIGNEILPGAVGLPLLAAKLQESAK